MDWFDDFFPDWDDWMIIGPLSEDFAEDEKNRKKIEKDYDDDDFTDDNEIV